MSVDYGFHFTTDKASCFLSFFTDRFSCQCQPAGERGFNSGEFVPVRIFYIGNPFSDFVSCFGCSVSISCRRN